MVWCVDGGVGSRFRIRFGVGMAMAMARMCVEKSGGWWSGVVVLYFKNKHRKCGNRKLGDFFSAG